MKQKTNITAIILTYNEEIHIKRVIENLQILTDEIIIVDSFSNDRTVEIAESMGAKCLLHKWENNHAKQFNWALDNAIIKTKWVMRLDADEYLLPELVEEIKNKLTNLDEKINGIYLKRRVYFMGKWIKRGGYYPTYLLRIWKKDAGKYEERWMDEHIILNGESICFHNDFVDDNLNDLSWWIQKHNVYSSREALDILNMKFNLEKQSVINESLKSTQEKRKRWYKNNIYLKLPMFYRCFFYFFYRYFILFGFMDGGKGFIFHFLQGLWYRFLVDSKVYQQENLINNDMNTMRN